MNHQNLSRGAVELGLGVLRLLPSNLSFNVVLSPWTLMNTIGILFLSTNFNSTSHEEFYKLPGISQFRGNPLEFHKNLSNLNQAIISTTSLLNSSTTSLHRAHIILHDTKQLENGLNSTHISLIKQYYSSLTTHPMLADSESCNHLLRDTMNEWAAKVTEDKVLQYFTEQLPKCEKPISLFDVSYFKGKWMNVVATSALITDRSTNISVSSALLTEQMGALFGYATFPDAEGPFETEARSEIEFAQEPLTNGLGADVLEIPYTLNKGKQFSMVILNPLSNETQVLNKLNGTVLEAIYKSLVKKQVVLQINKIRAYTRYNVIEILKAMKLTQLFDNSTSDSSHLFPSGSGSMWDSIQHKVKFEMTGKANDTLLLNILSPTYPTFTPKTPSFFVVRHKPTNFPIFMGRYIPQTTRVNVDTESIRPIGRPEERTTINKDHAI